MVACARRKLVGRIGVRKAAFHCSNRCVRRAFLCGRDSVTGQDYSHRRDWIVLREEQLASLFAIDIEFRSEMSNHLHVVLRPCPHMVRRLSSVEVVRRWLTITKLAKCLSDDLPEPDEQRIQEMAKDKKWVRKLRKRLCSISWFMGILQENIARRANMEDGCRGRFWETRFRVRECTDPSALLLCGIYVDVNPIKAGEAASPRTATYTSACQRIQAQGQRSNARERADGWMAELTLQPENTATHELAYSSRTGRRASDMGILPMSLDSYERLLNWTAVMLRSGERKTIPKDLASILDRMDIEQEAWLDTVDHYDALFCHAVGPCSSLDKVAARMEASRLKGTAASRRVFK